ncbi:MAG: NAD-dependent epimerase/dehydratase family protein [Chloroflexota bacterium]|nr:NAD-dependent epimerase/dehydratase family protein [Chloroflexota bacterium]
MKGTRTVVTGGGGFIGSRLLCALLVAGADVTLVGASLGKSAMTARLVHEGRVRFVPWGTDSWKGGLPLEVLHSAEALVLLGYTLPTSRDSAERRQEEQDLNVTPNIHLLGLTGDTLRHVVFASSVSVYGSPDRRPVHESDPVRPRTPYAVGKLAAEEALRDVADRRGLSLTTLRYATVYGPGETVPRAIPNFIRAALGRAPLLVDGDGLNAHDYLYVDDAVDATCAALRLHPNGTYNVATGIGTTTLEVARLILGITRSESEVVHRPQRQGEAERTRIVCATERARTDLGFSARWRLPEGVQREVTWFRDQRVPLAGVMAW